MGIGDWGVWGVGCGRRPRPASKTPHTPHPKTHEN